MQGEGKYGCWWGFNGDDIVLYPRDASGGEKGGKGIWRFVACDPYQSGATDMFYIENLGGGPSERRYGKWVGFRGGNFTLGLYTDNELDSYTGSKMIFQLVPCDEHCNPQENIGDCFMMKNVWGRGLNGYVEHYERWIGWKNTGSVVLYGKGTRTGPKGDMVAWRFHKYDGQIHTPVRPGLGVSVL